MNQPLISVIMSTYNDELYIEESLQSILNQTLADFELIIYDDCSSDHTVEKIRAFQDSRIQLICNEENCGLTKNLNKGLRIAKGKYIARMDGDDISEQTRFEEQGSDLISQIAADLRISGIPSLSVDLSASSAQTEALIYGTAMLLSLVEGDSSKNRIFTTPNVQRH